MLNYVAQQAIIAFEKNNMDKSWIDDRKHQYKNHTKIETLQSFYNLDGKNLRAVCAELNIPVAEMQATLRVFNKI